MSQEDNKKEPTISQNGSVNLSGDINAATSITVQCGTPEAQSETRIIELFNAINSDIESYPSEFEIVGELKRKETDQLLDFINNDLKKEERPIAVLAGNAGYGKSVIMKEVLLSLKEKNIPTLALKADYLPIKNISELQNELHLNESLDICFKKLSQKYKRVVLIVDQIDALSQTLSSDRSSLHAYNRIIESISVIPNIRIVISCRFYDLDYEPLLNKYHKCNIIKVGELTDDQTKFVLEKNGYDVTQLNKYTIDFLKVPLHLQLFCKINDHNEVKNVESLNNLYCGLWEKYIINHPKELDTQKLQNLLKEMAFDMYDHQKLVLNKNKFVDRYDKELKYSESSDLIKQVGDMIQFFHQSFFDYTYARSYVILNKKLSEDLQTQHQGLFIRSRVRQVFTYLRDVDKHLYIQEFKTILNGDEYKFHIKLLLINELGFQKNLYDEEKMLFKEMISKNDYLYQLFLESVWSSQWLQYLIDEGYVSDIFNSTNEKLIEPFSNICRKLYNNANTVINLLDLVCNSKYEKKYTFISRILATTQFTDMQATHTVFLKTKNYWDVDDYYLYLGIIFEYGEIDFVLEALKKKVEVYYEKVNIYKNHNYIPDGNHIYIFGKNITKKYPDKWYNFLAWLIPYVAQETKINILPEDEELVNCWAFHNYSPNGSIVYGEIDSFYSQYMNLLSNKAKECPDEIKATLKSLVESDISSIISLAVGCYATNPKFYKNEILQAFKEKRYWESSGILSYNMGVLLKKAFPYLYEDEKNSVFNLIIGLHPKWESFKYKSNDKTYYNKYIGHTAFKYLCCVQIEEINKHAPIKKIYEELKRKFGDNIKNEPPEGVMTHIGWTSLPSETYKHFTDKDWLRSFESITIDNHMDWDKPTLTGNGQVFKTYVNNDWQKFKALLSKISKDTHIPIEYARYGLKGLCDAKADILFIQKVYENIIARKDFNPECESISVIWDAEYLIKNNGLSDNIFNFIYNIANDEKCESKIISEKSAYDYVIQGANTTRGAAADMLVECYNYPQYKDKIFDALFKVAVNGSISTKAITLFRLALLNNLDKDKNMDLFLALTNGFEHPLLSLPIHNLNPLIYLIYVDFNKLVPYFEKAMTIKEAGKSVKICLFIAWIHNKEKSEELLSKSIINFIDGTEEALKIAFDTLNDSKYKERCKQFIFRCLDFDDKKLGNVVDIQFDKIKYFDTTKEQYSFIDRYISSPLAKYRKDGIYDYLLNVAEKLPERCIEWALLLTQKGREEIYYYENKPIQVIIKAYNSIQKFDPQDDILNKAIDAFDNVLKGDNTRSLSLNYLNKLDSY